MQFAQPAPSQWRNSGGSSSSRRPVTVLNSRNSASHLLANSSFFNPLSVNQASRRLFSSNRRLYCSSAELPAPPEKPPADGVYKRELPDSLVAFSSPEGRKRLQESLHDGSGDAFFELSEQFLTQVEPPVCGPATLAMVFNSLRQDPGRVWKGPWRWYNEDMLQSCDAGLELSDATNSTRGFTMYEVALVAECSGAHVQVRNASSKPEDLARFRREIIHWCGKAGIAAGRPDGEQHSTARLICNFSRTRLDQTGSGHYSPVAAYHAKSDSVLVMDVARFKYPPFWVEVERLWAAMQDPDPDTQLPRGYMVISGQQQSPDVCEPEACGCDLNQVRERLRGLDAVSLLKALEAAPLRHAVVSYTHDLRQRFAKSPLEMHELLSAVPVPAGLQALARKDPSARSVLDVYPQWRGEIASLFHMVINQQSLQQSEIAAERTAAAIQEELRNVEDVLSGKPREKATACSHNKTVSQVQ